MAAAPKASTEDDFNETIFKYRQVHSKLQKKSWNPIQRSLTEPEGRVVSADSDEESIAVLWTANHAVYVDLFAVKSLTGNGEVALQYEVSLAALMPWSHIRLGPERTVYFSTFEVAKQHQDIEWEATGYEWTAFGRERSKHFLAVTSTALGAVSYAAVAADEAVSYAHRRSAKHSVSKL